ncbi:hypothetical protein D3C75_1191590 [compost metagenome]
MVHQVQVGAVEMVGEKRAAWATFAPAFGEHEVVDQQLAAPGEQVGEAQLAVRALKTVGLFQLDPGQGAAGGGQLVALVGEGLFMQP